MDIELGSGNANERPNIAQSLDDSTDGQPAKGLGKLLGVVSRLQSWSGAQWERFRSNVSNVSLAVLAAAAAGANGGDQVNSNARGVKIIIDITLVAGTAPTLTVTLQGKDPVSGKYFTILASAALGAAGTTVLTVYPGVAAVANVSASDVLPRDWRVIYAVGGSAGQAITATIAASLIN